LISAPSPAIPLPANFGWSVTGYENASGQTQPSERSQWHFPVGAARHFRDKRSARSHNRKIVV
jgi:hypothetical protein